MLAVLGQAPWPAPVTQRDQLRGPLRPQLFGASGDLRVGGDDGRRHVIGHRSSVIGRVWAEGVTGAGGASVGC